MSEARLNSFLGVDFGSSLESAKEKLLSREGCTLNEENSSNDTLIFNGLTFAGRQTSFVILYFINDKFCKSVIYITPKLEAYTIQTYKEIQNELNTKYFTAKDFEFYDEPYEKNDGYTETGISLGKVTFESYWSFKDANGGKDDFISLKISDDLSICLVYEDGDLTDEMVNDIMSKNSEDY